MIPVHISAVHHASEWMSENVSGKVVCTYLHLRRPDYIDLTNIRRNE
jgi:hypothetical protein